jgi:uncharacterized protein (TIGR02246 family)
MNRTPVGATLAVIFMGLFSLPVLSARAQSNSSDADSAAIRQVVASVIDGFNRHDARAWTTPFLDDGDFTNVTGLTLHGRSKIEERFKGLFATRLKDAHRSATVRHVRFVKADVAAVDAEWELVGSKTDEGAERPVRKGIFTWVMVKLDGQWKFADFHESEFFTK